MHDYSVDGLKPSEVLRPASVEELSAQLKRLHGSGLAAIPWGGGTRMHVGNMPERYDVALDLSGLDTQIEHEPGDLTVVVSAGVRVADLNARLATAGQRLPFDTPEPERATIGGSVASNAPGAMRSSFGGIRDWVIGVTVVLADGDVTKSGGRVVKNVQGYDLHRLHTGAFGTLGVISQVAFKLTPLPARTQTVAAAFSSIEPAAAAASSLFNAPFTPEALSLFHGGGAAKATATHMPRHAAGASTLLLARLAGGPASVARQASETSAAMLRHKAVAVRTFGPDEDTPVWQRAADSPLPVQVSARAALRQSAAYEVLKDLETADARFTGLALHARIDCGFGALTADWWAKTDEDAREAINASFQAARRHGGLAVIERCPHHLKRGLDVFGESTPALAIMRGMKEQYDPARILNPGRFIGGI